MGEGWMRQALAGDASEASVIRSDATVMLSEAKHPGPFAKGPDSSLRSD